MAVRKAVAYIPNLTFSTFIQIYIVPVAFKPAWNFDADLCTE